MSKTFAKLAILPALFLLGACTGYDTDLLNRTKVSSSDKFVTTLVAEYKRAAAFESNIHGSWEDADMYARKGLDAIAGKTVEPWAYTSPHVKVPDRAKAFAALWQEQLVTALANGGRTKFPEDCAKAQVKWDEWLDRLTDGTKAEIQKDQDDLVPLLEKCNVPKA